ncbi:GNAT family N-acetyltransferase [Amycolatopsis sp. NPDC005232]|uniref:GNAT family N-acetyltransferase n=1 Tax=Amycolatopsis sp. NPDC005232 TaxID=3157027 RepID=UPI0033BA2895
MTDPLLAAYDAEVRTAELTTAEPGTTLDRDAPVTRILGARRGFVVGPPDLGVTGPSLDALIDRQVRFFASRGEAFEWKTRAYDRPADLPDRLLAAGFAPEETETVLIAPVSAISPSAAPSADVTIREATGEADLRRIAHLSATVFGSDEAAVARDLIARAREDNEGTTVHVVAESAGRLVSAARLELVGGTTFAGLWGGATLPDFRGRGLYRALVAHRAATAHTRGARYLQVDALPPSRPILQRLGFTAVTTTTPYVWTSA